MRLIDADDAIEAITNYAKFLWDNYHETCNLAGMIDAIEALPAAEPRWIPVTERLPEEGWCLCTVHGVFYDYCEILSCQKHKRKMRFLRLDDDGEYVDFTKWVMAWMPLPEPWRGEEG